MSFLSQLILFGLFAALGLLLLLRKRAAGRDGSVGRPGRFITRWLFDREQRRPARTLETAPFTSQPLSGDTLRVTWMGHASVLVELDGARVLTDPVWSARCSPVSFVGPRRFAPPPVPLAALPPLDAVLISHDHYDHLDRATVTSLARLQPRALFLVPLGVGAHLRRWGVPAERIRELGWHQSVRLARAPLELIALPARHFSGRGLQGNGTLFASWALIGPRHRVYFGGDTGAFEGHAAIGAAHGPFDATLLPIGAYDESWPDVHLDPEQAVAAHAALRGRFLLPIHWGTFRLALHAWYEPAERLLDAGHAAGIAFAVPRPGETVSPETPGANARWWATPSTAPADVDPAPV